MGAWQALAAAGDTYAGAAAQVIGDPTSKFGQVTRNVWNESGADFANFGMVASDYQSRYLSQVFNGEIAPGLYNLPNTTSIEENYLGALAGVTHYAAIDANVSLTPFAPAWYGGFPFLALETTENRAIPRRSLSAGGEHLGARRFV